MSEVVPEAYRLRIVIFVSQIRPEPLDAKDAWTLKMSVWSKEDTSCLHCLH